MRTYTESTSIATDKIGFLKTETKKNTASIRSYMLCRWKAVIKYPENEYASYIYIYIYIFS